MTYILCTIHIYIGFIQPATGPQSVCLGGGAILNCTIQLFAAGLNFTVNAEWIRNGVVITDRTPRHVLLRTQTEDGLVITGLMINSTTVSDDKAVYTCSAPDNSAITTVVLNVTKGTYV